LFCLLKAQQQWQHRDVDLGQFRIEVDGTSGHISGKFLTAFPARSDNWLRASERVVAGQYALPPVQSLARGCGARHVLRKRPEYKEST